MPKLTELGVKVKTKLISDNMTQIELAERIGVSIQHLSAVLRGSSALLLEEYLQDYVEGKSPEPFVLKERTRNYQVGDTVTVMYQGKIKRGKIKRIDTRLETLRYTVEGCHTKMFFRTQFEMREQNE